MRSSYFFMLYRKFPFLTYTFFVAQMIIIHYLCFRRYYKGIMKQENTPKKSLTRREFLKRFHSAAAVTCASTWVGCTPKQKNTDAQTSVVSSKKKGEMTYRITANTGDKVSLLGYGCLRWASVLDKETGAKCTRYSTWVTVSKYTCRLNMQKK